MISHDSIFFVWLLWMIFIDYLYCADNLWYFAMTDRIFIQDLLIDTVIWIIAVKIMIF